LTWENERKHIKSSELKEKETARLAVA
jgi:hypothetical protein